MSMAWLLFLVGWVMFIIGAAMYWNADPAATEGSRTQGMDFLIAGSIMILPGTYAVVVIFGSWMKWKGFGYHHLPSLD
jgi:Transmembrane proteins 230/134